MKHVLLMVLILSASVATADDTNRPSYVVKEEAYRQKREAGLKADGGWLTVTGLFWLREGANTLGSGPENDIVLPESSPAQLGTLHVEKGQARFVSAGAEVLLNGRPVTASAIKSGADILSYGPLDFLLITRSNRLAVRLKDKNSVLRKNFTRLSWFPVDEEWRITGRYVKSDQPSPLVLDTIIGDQTQMRSSGYVEFQRAGQTFRLLAIDQGKRLFFVLRDRTSGRTTYASSRFLYAEPSADGTVILDFNRAENPPCAFTPYATCPLPPAQNRLPLTIEAGEKKYEGGSR